MSNSDDTSKDDEELQPVQEFAQSSFATEISELKHRLRGAIDKHPRLPQPTFWCLFRAELSKIKRHREFQRTVEKLFNS